MSAWMEEFRCELRKLVRDPQFVLPSLGFPIAFFLLFGVVLPYAKTEAARWIVMANYAGFAVLASSLFASSLPLARERETGVYAIKRTTPLSSLHFIWAKLLAAALFGTLSAVAVLVLACICYGMLPGIGAVVLFLTICLGAGLSLSALGLWIGSHFRLNAAAGIVNLVFMPMAFLGGLAMPLAIMPKAVQQLALVLPSFHVGELLRAALSPLISLTNIQIFYALLCFAIFAAIGLFGARQKLLRSVD
jgi:ABC-2 type transport system permease protein